MLFAMNFAYLPGASLPAEAGVYGVFIYAQVNEAEVCLAILFCFFF